MNQNLNFDHSHLASKKTDILSYPKEVKVLARITRKEKKKKKKVFVFVFV